jgi:PAS domain S-box-containing protein
LDATAQLNTKDLGTALDAIQEGLQVIDRQWRYVYLNRAAEVHARRPREELVGRTMMECYPGIEGTVVFGLMRTCMETGAPASTQNTFTYPDGLSYSFEIRIQPADCGVMVLSADVTLGKKLQHQLRDAEHAETAARATRLLEEMSREFAAETYDLDRLLDAVARRLGELVGDLCAIRPVSEDGEWLESTSATYHPDPAVLSDIRKMAVAARQRVGEGISGRVASTGKAEFVPKIGTSEFATMTEPHYRELLDRLGVGSSIAVPLLCRGKVLGVINLTRSAERPGYTEADFRLVQRIADHAALAVGNARSYAAERAARDAAEQAMLAVRHAESRFARLSESGILGVVVGELPGRIVEINDALLDVVGYSRDDVLSGRVRWGDLTPPEWRHVDEEAIVQLRARGVGELREKEYLRKDGTRVPVLIGSAALEGTPYRAISFVLDLTTRKSAEVGRARAEAALRKTEEQFRQAQKMEAIGRLAGGVAHDFNNMLSVILSYTEMLLSDDAETRSRAELEEIRGAGARAAALTRQLLLFSRQTVVQPKKIDLSDLLVGMDKMLQRILGEDIELTAIVQSSLGRVEADPGNIEQVILNLVVNARDAMPTGGKLTLETADVVVDDEFVQAHVGMKPGAYVMLAASDTGVGMDAETQKRIFEPFFTTKELGKGTGLGLSTVFGIVQQSGGTIWVYSEPGKGTTFKIYLPRVDGEPEARRSRASSYARAGNETVLLVEDEDQVRLIAGRILERQGYRVLVAQDPDEAMKLCETHEGRIDLLLTDVVMPRMSGPDLAERLTGMRPQLKVLCMSGYTDDSIVRHGVLKSGIAYLQKPFTPASLTTKVREVLDSSGV